MTWITAREVDDAEFTTRRVRRGYDEAEVDLFLDRVALDVHEMQAEIAALRAENEALRSAQPSMRLEPEHCFGCGSPSHFWAQCPVNPNAAPHDWQEQMAAELAPEALAQLVPLPSVDEGPQRDVPEPGGALRLPASEATMEVSPQGSQRAGFRSTGNDRDGSPGLGHPSPYPGPLTPAQRRRDKHKQRGQYAPAPGWTADPQHINASHWKPEGDRWMAEWRIEWQDDVAAVDEEIAEWVERQRGWLAADRWDRGARRLGAVA